MENKETVATATQEIKKAEYVKVIGRISKGGREYFQTAINNGGEDNDFIPVFLKKGIEKLNYKSMENKVDKRGVVYTLYEVPFKNVFMPKNEDGKIEKAIVTR